MASKQQDPGEQRLMKMTQDWIEQVGTPMLFAPISLQQMATSADRPAKGKKWASRATFSAPTGCDSIQDAVSGAIKHIGDGTQQVAPFAVEDVNVQWSAYRPGAGEQDPEPDISEEDKYKALMKDVTAPITILYSHGGFYYTGSPASSRNCTVVLSQLTKGRCLAVDYRLAPQNPFPSAVVDLFVAYLTLLYPRPGDFHEPVPPANIVFAGDSSGTNLLLSLLQVLHYVRDQRGGKINFHDQSVSVPLPAGVAIMCGHADHTNSFPSHTHNLPYDIFYADVLPYLHDNFPDCGLWPTDPPRGDIYTETPTLVHPMVAVSIAPAWSEAKMPPMYFASGEEKLIDECYFIATRARKAGTVVQFSQYDRLPHIFPLLFPRLEQSKHVFQEWAKFIVRCVLEKDKLENRNIRYKVKGTSFEAAELNLSDDTDVENAKRRMLARIKDRKPWTGPKETPKL